MGEKIGILSNCFITNPNDVSENFNSSVPELTIVIEIGSPKSKLVFSVTIDNEVPST